MIYNRIPVIVGGLRKINLPPIMYQYDQVQKLILTDIELPESYRVDFCNDGDTRTITMVGTADGVEIPNQLLQTGKSIKAFVVLSGVDENAVETRIDINIPVNKRPPASDIAPTPAQQTTIDTLIEAMNTAVEDAETAEQGAKDAQQAIEDMTVSAETLAPGSAATVTKTIIEDVVHLLFGIPRGQQGKKGDPGEKGDTGNGIASITLISTSGLNKTYRITYTNGNHFDYVVTDGEKGDTGNGIYSIYKTGTSGKVDTYTILFTDGNTTDFTVTNGTDGEDGVSPEVTITTITGGHRVTITDADHPTGQSFDVMDGQDGQNTDAEHVTYDSTQTYSSGTVGAGLNQLNSDITAKPNIDLGITGASVGTFAKVKTVDESGKPTSWEYGSGGGGGGGTSDYTDLTNKPSINGVTLSGNKTASDLGLGTYSKPSTGIPASDLASGVIPTVPDAATATPQALGTAAVGTSTKYAREDHVHAQPTYTASDVGALPSNTTYVSSVNGSSGAVTVTVPSTAADVGAIAAPSSPTTGAFLVYNGSAWVAQTLATWQGGNY